jgi:hypothetical protein
MRSSQNIELINLALGSEVGDKTVFEYDKPNLNSPLPNAQYAVRFGDLQKDTSRGA